MASSATGLKPQPAGPHEIGEVPPEHAGICRRPRCFSAPRSDPRKSSTDCHERRDSVRGPAGGGASRNPPPGRRAATRPEGPSAQKPVRRVRSTWSCRRRLGPISPVHLARPDLEVEDRRRRPPVPKPDRRRQRATSDNAAPCASGPRVLRVDRRLSAGPLVAPPAFCHSGPIGRSGRRSRLPVAVVCPRAGGSGRRRSGRRRCGWRGVRPATVAAHQPPDQPARCRVLARTIPLPVRST